MTHGEVLILSLLKYKSFHGYELEKIIEKNMMRDWTKIGFSSIYSILNKLYKKKLIDFNFEVEQGGPKRKVYSITNKGEECLMEELGSMLSVPKCPQSDLDIGIVFSHLMTLEERNSYLNKHREQLVADIEENMKILEKNFKHMPTVVLLFRRNIAHAEADIKWIDEILAES